MKISTKGRYALRALVDLAEFSDKMNKYVSLTEIAKRQNMSKKYLENLFSTLKNRGIVRSQRGTQGGYHLAQSPQEITALDIINAIEGPVSFVDCCISDKFCKRTKNCKTIKLWKKINNKIVSELDKTSLKDLMI